MSERVTHENLKRLQDNWDFFLPLASLERHYGISHAEVRSASVSELVSTGKFPGLLVKWQVHLQNGKSQAIYTWFSSRMLNALRDQSIGLVRELVWENLGDLGLVFQEGALKGDQGDIAFIYESTKTLGPIQGVRGFSEESTNQHYVLTFSQALIRGKIYSNPNKGLKEVQTVSKLAAAGAYPVIRASISLSDVDPRPVGTLALFYDELNDARNIDHLTGNAYSNFLVGETSLDECQVVLNEYLERAFSALARLHATLNQRPIIPDEAKSSLENMQENLMREINGEHFQTVGLESIADDVLLRQLNRLFQLDRASWIHGDVWWRQFITDEKNQVYLLDLEDLRIGFLGYDLGSWINSIFQQAEYYAKDLARRLRTQVKGIANTLVSDLWTIVQSHAQYKDVSRLEVDMGRLMRSIHELNYLAAHQPAETWLIQFIDRSCKEVLQHLIRETDLNLVRNSD